MEYEYPFAYDLTGSVEVGKESNDRVPSDDISNLPCHASQGTSVDEFSLTSRELVGYNSSSRFIIQSTNGIIAFQNNQYQTNDGVYHYQYQDGVTVQDAPWTAYWQTPPSRSTTGGLVWTQCGYYG